MERELRQDGALGDGGHAQARARGRKLTGGSTEQFAIFAKLNLKFCIRLQIVEFKFANPRFRNTHFMIFIYD